VDSLLGYDQVFLSVVTGPVTVVIGLTSPDR
jgi:hypothetical protein